MAQGVSANGKRRNFLKPGTIIKVVHWLQQYAMDRERSGKLTVEEACAELTKATGQEVSPNHLTRFRNEIPSLEFKRLSAGPGAGPLASAMIKVSHLEGVVIALGTRIELLESRLAKCEEILK